MSVAQSILDKVPHLPESPGVYLWKDAEGKVLYVGKAKRLRSRVRSYVASDHRESLKTRALMQQAEALDTIVVPTEAHALVLEANLIKEYKPRFNIALRDDKSYPYIKVTVQEPFPRVWVTRRLQNDGARYFGPYTDVGAMRRALDVVKRLFTVRSCNFDMPAQMPERPCLDYHIGRCKAPCILAQTQGEYAAMIDEVLDFLAGKPDMVSHPVYSDYVKDSYHWQASSVKYAVKSPIYGLNVQEPANISQFKPHGANQTNGIPLDNKVTDILHGRAPVSDLKYAVQSWRQSGGDQYRAFYASILGKK